MGLEAPETNEELVAKVREIAGEAIKEAFKIRQKQARSAKLDEAWNAVKDALITEETDTLAANEIKGIFKHLEADVVRTQILEGQPRIDGRDTRTVRPLNIQTGVLPRTHGSALFTRGETQALAVATLGTSRDEQIIDALSGEYTDRFMLHYNFPPYSTGEVGRVARERRESDMAAWQNAHWLPYCRPLKNSATPCVLFPRLPSPTVRLLWLPSAAAV